MCYIRPVKIKTPKQTVFYKVVKRKRLRLYSLYVNKYLPVGKQLRARNIKSPFNSRHNHSYKRNFIGWGVFQDIILAEKYVRSEVSSRLRSRTEIVKVTCQGRARKSATLCEISCYIFDKITILED